MVKLYKSAAVVALLVVSSAASAATSITLTSAGLYAPGLITITPAAGTTAPAAGNYYASVLKFAAVSGGAAIDLLGFCIDLFHPISAGIDSQSSFSLTYASLPLTNDQNSTTLSGSQVQQMMGLASLGFTIAASDAPDRASRLAAIQQAIWTIEYPTLGFAAAGGYATQQGYANTYVALAPTLTGTATAIYPNDGATQGFLISDVPEPQTWTLLVVGFGFAGVGLRRRTGATRVAA